MLYQDSSMTHSWFINFDKNFRTQFLVRFLQWWMQFVPILDIFPRPLAGSLKHFSSTFRTGQHGAEFHATLYFVKKYKEEEEVANADSEDEDEQEFVASSKASVSKKDDPYYPYDQALFGHDLVSTPDLADD
nr:hypothetical protein CFP56_29661 [Quercus suber]